ncbi:hypothetical protein GCM10023162_19290 [Klenkia terrae]
MQRFGGVAAFVLHGVEPGLVKVFRLCAPLADESLDVARLPELLVSRRTGSPRNPCPVRFGWRDETGQVDVAGLPGEPAGERSFQ